MLPGREPTLTPGMGAKSRCCSYRWSRRGGVVVLYVCVLVKVVMVIVVRVAVIVIVVVSVIVIVGVSVIVIVAVVVIDVPVVCVVFVRLYADCCPEQ